MLRLLIAALLAAPPVCATLCSPKPIWSERLDSHYILRGTIERVDFLEPPRRVPDPSWPGETIPVPRRFVATIRVTAVWKGVVGRTVQLHEMEYDGMGSGFTTHIGADVLVFAAAHVVSGPIPDVWEFRPWRDVLPIGTRILQTTGLCGLSGRAEHVTDTIRALGRPRYFVHR